MSAKGIQITERDRLLFHTMQKFGFLTSKMINDICFNSLTKQAGYQRLKKMHDYGLISRTTPIGQTEYWYYVTEKIRPFLDNTRPLKKLHKQWLVHDVGLSLIMFKIFSDYRDEKIFFETDLWLFESHFLKSIRKHKGKVHSNRLMFLPDGGIQFPKLNALYFLEFDRSTEWGLKFHQKIWAYEEYFKSGTFKNEFGEILDRFRVLLLCKGQERINGIMNTYTKKELTLFVFTTHQEFLSNDKPLHKSIWQHVGMDGKFALGRG
ncbi:replication-relaxation family protein [bacterium]|nr:replication-relaxation family protein [bacterium]